MRILFESIRCFKCGSLACRDFHTSGKWYKCEKCGNYFELNDKYYKSRKAEEDRRLAEIIVPSLGKKD
jgi:DNA-directed RNA polymerase subunit M/transcription elongation factor TFIIS